MARPGVILKGQDVKITQILSGRRTVRYTQSFTYGFPLPQRSFLFVFCIRLKEIKGREELGQQFILMQQHKCVLSNTTQFTITLQDYIILVSTTAKQEFYAILRCYPVLYPNYELVIFFMVTILTFVYRYIREKSPYYLTQGQSSTYIAIIAVQVMTSGTINIHGNRENFSYVAQTVVEVANTESDTKNRLNPQTPLHQQPAAKFLGLVSL